MRLRTKFRLFLVAVSAFGALAVGYSTYNAAPAAAFCGGGAPGEPCYCPPPTIDKNGIHWIYC